MKFKFIEIESIEYKNENLDMYDLEVEDDNSYNIDGIAVHNSVCTTRLVAGVGYPQLSAAIEAADIAHGLGGHVCSDGGIKNPADICKAFGAGSDFIMCGGMFAGTAQCEGNWVSDGKEKLLEFYGMSSKVAQDQYNGGLASHRASEGKSVVVPYKGPVEDVLQQITGGLRSCCAYVGASTLKDLPKCTTFIKVNRTHNTVFGA